MSELELLLTDNGEITTRNFVKKKNPYGLKENKEISIKGGNISKITKEHIEKELGEEIITKENNLNYIYSENNYIENKKDT